MARGKCSGCGLENVSSAKVRRHLTQCPDYAALYKSEPAKCLDPEVEMENFRTFRQSDEGQDAKADKRAERLDKWTEFQETKSSLAQQRWSDPTLAASLQPATLRPEEVLALVGARMYGEQITEALDADLTPTERVIRQAFLGDI